MKYEILVLIVASLTLVLSYIYLSTTEIPITTYTLDVTSTNYLTMAPNTFPTNGLANCSLADVDVANSAVRDSTIMSLNLTFPIFVVAMLGFVGWFFFVVFAGVGLAALPVDLVCAYVYRPRHMDAVEFAEAQLSVRNRVKDLIEVRESEM